MRRRGDDNLVAGPAIIVVAVLCLWANEGRFDYYRAARQASEIPNPRSAHPGQAISYKVGERVILELRDELRAREGEGFDLKEFHSRVLGSGPVGLEHLREIVLGD